MTVEQLQKAPFYLDYQDITWVRRTLDAMTTDEKIGQLFFPIAYSPQPEDLDRLLEAHVGGILFRAGPAKEIREAHTYLQEHTRVPLLLAANLESGGNGLVLEGTPYGCNMQVAATDDPIRSAEHLGEIACKEAAAVGCNFSFAPDVDIDMNAHNPITNVRTFGSDPQRVEACGRAYIRGAQSAGCATAAKHFPGDGVDERDQHLLTSINTLSVQDWDATFGKVYAGIIEEGTLSIMAGHIALPAYARALGATAQEAALPATLSPVLISRLLREKLGFQGLVISDATPMVGFCSAMKREDAVPSCFMAGCDMFLFNKDLQEDIVYMKRGLERGVLTEARLEEAVIRILGLKAALGLHEKQERHALIPSGEAQRVIGCPVHMRLARDCADASVTLVKDTDSLLPLHPQRHNRLLLEVLGDFPSNARVEKTVTQLLSEQGFHMIPYVREGIAQDGSLMVDTVEQFKAKYDAVLYVGNIENVSNRTTNRINWYTFFGLGNNIPWFVHEVPTVFLSLGNPYHLLDVPMIGTYINAYGNSDIVIEAAVKKLLGQAPFRGHSPSDPEGFLHTMH